MRNEKIKMQTVANTNGNLLINSLARIVVLFVGFTFLTGCGEKTEKSNAEEFYTISDYASVPKIDAHVHIRTADTAFVHQAGEDNFRLLTVVVEESPGLESQYENAIFHSGKFPERVAFATTFSIENWGYADWEEEVIGGLEQSLAEGAVAVKVYKIIGMELQDDSGDFVMVDDDSFRPVFRFLEERQVPVIGHLGEPRNCWLPVDEMTIRSDSSYFTRHPEFHMYLHPEYPSYEEQIAARDRVLKDHPDLPFVGAHLGSIEWSTEELARRLDAYPNFAVDMAARISSLQYQTMEDREKVREFMIKYQDRLLYGTDRIANDDDEPEEFKEFLHRSWVRDWTYFTTEEMMESPSFEGEFRGLKLPKSVVDKIYFHNALKWFPKLDFL